MYIFKNGRFNKEIKFNNKRFLCLYPTIKQLLTVISYNYSSGGGLTGSMTNMFNPSKWIFISHINVSLLCVFFI